MFLRSSNIELKSEMDIHSHFFFLFIILKSLSLNKLLFEWFEHVEDGYAQNGYLVHSRGEKMMIDDSSTKNIHNMIFVSSEKK